MEKFGIFELLDALSAITAANEPSAVPSAQPPFKEHAETISPNQTDAAFLPPALDPESARLNAVQKTSERNAFDAFLNRHNAISRKLDGKR